jgi:hypothetical protein
MEMNDALAAKREERKAVVWSSAEKVLLIAAIVLAILFDRLIINQVFESLRILPAIFWLSYLAIFYVIFWKRVKNDAVLWFVSACVAALSVWNFIFEGWGVNWQYRVIAALVIPAVLMAHAQWAAHSFSWKNSDSEIISMLVTWLEGWFIKPFSGLPAFFGVSFSMLSGENKSKAARAVIGFLIVGAMMLVIIPLLMGADQVFGHYMSRIFHRIRFSSIIFHGIVITTAFGLFYSFLWNIGFGKNEAIKAKISASIDKIISTVILGSVICVYVAFCIVQFTYLFARAGLPYGMTYSEYAREGFAQTVAVCAINLLIFGVFLWLGSPGKLLTTLQASLLALTGIKLISGAIRLHLYIDTFGMTWLRLISAWFIIYLAATIILCIVRLFTKKQMPLMGICSLLLLAWFVALGYLNPEGFINWWNN